MLPSWHQHLKDVVRVGNLGYDVGPVPKRRWSQGVFFEHSLLAGFPYQHGSYPTHHLIRMGRQGTQPVRLTKLTRRPD